MILASSLEYALLGLLRQQPQSGYDLRKSFVSTPMRHFSDSPGSIYPALRRLRTRKWIRVVRQEQGRNRQVFQITAAGNHSLIAWLKQLPAREDVIWRMEEVMVRFAFQTGNVPLEVSLAFLSELEQQLAEYVDELCEYAKQFEWTKAKSTGALAFASGIEGYETQLAWTKKARKRLMEVLS
jgi:DNA-binding PadR family transcriptional regulator